MNEYTVNRFVLDRVCCIIQHVEALDLWSLLFCCCGGSWRVVEGLRAVPQLKGCTYKAVHTTVFMTVCTYLQDIRLADLVQKVTELDVRCTTETAPLLPLKVGEDPRLYAV
jgi:hypothetical protein